MIRIGLDAFGGDNGEKEVIRAAICSLKENKDISLIIFGDEEIIKNEFSNANFDYANNNVTIVDAKEKIDMNDR